MSIGKFKFFSSMFKIIMCVSCYGLVVNRSFSVNNVMFLVVCFNFVKFVS